MKVTDEKVPVVAQEPTAQAFIAGLEVYASAVGDGGVMV
jgi:hypothetical protein